MSDRLTQPMRKFWIVLAKGNEAPGGANRRFYHHDTPEEAFGEAERLAVKTGNSMRVMECIGQVRSEDGQFARVTAEARHD